MADDPDFKRADLIPVSILWICPGCDVSTVVDTLVEDDAGMHSVPMEERFVLCDECGTLVDIGWAGWPWHDAARAPEAS